MLFLTIGAGALLAHCAVGGSGSRNGDSNEIKPPPGSSGGTGANAGTPEGTGLDVDLGDAGPISDALVSSEVGDACGVTSEEAQLTKVNMIFMLDTSGSMGNPEDQFEYNRENYERRWVPVSQALKEFFADPGSTDLRASLDYFPSLGGPDVSCMPDEYSEDLEVDLRSLDEGTTRFYNAIDLKMPEGGTPTVPALMGAVTTAREVMAEHPEDITVVVFITDGEPAFYLPCSGEPFDVCANIYDEATCLAEGCAFESVATKANVPGCQNLENTIDQAEIVAQQAFQGIPLDDPSGTGAPSVSIHVIGVGKELDALDRIAEAGGTSEALLLDPDSGDAAQAAQAVKEGLMSKLESLRTLKIACETALPQGEGPLDFTTVNVALTKGGVTDNLNYNADAASCSSAGGVGWRYDQWEPGSTTIVPTKILVCQGTCDAIQGDATARLQFSLGCEPTRDLPR